MGNLLTCLLVGLVVYACIFHQPTDRRAAAATDIRTSVFVLPTGKRAKLTLEYERSALRAVAPPYADDYGSWFREMHTAYEPQLRYVYETIRREVDHERYDLDEVVLRIVQQIPYEYIPDTYRGRPAYGIFPPLVTLYENYGDCDSKSLLLASLLTHEHPVLLLFGEQHALVGLPGDPRPGDHWVRVAGRTWLLCETTSVGPIGRVGPGTWQDIQEGKYEALLLD